MGFTIRNYSGETFSPGAFRFALDFSLPIPTFPRPTICPWVSEDGVHTKDPSCLQKTSKEDMLAFFMDKLASELENRAPMLHSVLSAATVNGRSRAQTITLAARFGAIGMAAAMCL